MFSPTKQSKNLLQRKTSRPLHERTIQNYARPFRIFANLPANKPMLKFLDILLTLAHFAIIGFNLFGWISPRTRKAHLIVVGATAFSWFILGIWFGWGYCPITEWQWNVKGKLGETNLPNSFIKYYVDKISGKDVNPWLVDMVTLVTFLAVIALAVYQNFFRRKMKEPQS
jgi:hypothetical protein